MITVPPQHWFMTTNTSHSNDHQHHTLYNLQKHSSATTNPSAPSIFGHRSGLNSLGTALISPRSPPLLYHNRIMPENELAQQSPSPPLDAEEPMTNRVPQIQLNDDVSDEMTHITHLIKHLSFTIQEMNQFLDAHQGPDSKRDGVTAKTTNCRNEMVSTLSYYQTYIQSNSPRLRSHTNSRSPRSPPPPYTLDEDHRVQQSLLSPSSQRSHTLYSAPSKRPMIEQDADYGLCVIRQDSNQSFGPSASNGSKKGNLLSPQQANESANAKQIALDVVGNVIGTPGPMMRDSSLQSQLTQMETPDMIASAFGGAQTANSQQAHEELHKSKLNAYAQPYQTRSPYQPSMDRQHSNHSNPHRHPPSFAMPPSQHTVPSSHPAPPPPPSHHQATGPQQRAQQHLQAVNALSSPSHYVQPAHPSHQPVSQQLSPQRYTQSAAEQYLSAQPPPPQHAQSASTAVAPPRPPPIVCALQTAPAPQVRPPSDERLLGTALKTRTANGYTTTHTAPGFVRPLSKARSQNRTQRVNGYTNGHSNGHCNGVSHPPPPSLLQVAQSPKVDDPCTGNGERHSDPMNPVNAVKSVSEMSGMSGPKGLERRSPDRLHHGHYRPRVRSPDVAIRTQSKPSGTASYDAEVGRQSVRPPPEHDENVSINHGDYARPSEVRQRLDFDDLDPESTYNGSNAPFDEVEACDMGDMGNMGDVEDGTQRAYSLHSDHIHDASSPKQEIEDNARDGRRQEQHAQQQEEQGESSSNPFCGDSPNTNSITTNTNSTKSSSPKRPAKPTKSRRSKKQPTPKAANSSKSAAKRPNASPSKTQTRTQTQAQSQTPSKNSKSPAQKGGANKSSNNRAPTAKPTNDNTTSGGSANSSSKKEQTASSAQQSTTTTATTTTTTAKACGAPLWSAIAKTRKTVASLSKKTLCSSAEEKTPEGSITDSDYAQFNVNSRRSSNYWKNRTNNYQSSLSTSSYSSASSKDNHITPSPTPPEHTKNRSRGSKRANGNGNGHGGGNNHGGNGRGIAGRNSTPPKGGSGGNNANERCRVFVSNLPPNVTDEDIRAAFARCGEIANTVWFPSRTDGKFYGSGLITFARHSGSENALRLNQQNVLGRIIRVEYSSCQDPVKVKPPGCRTIYLNNVPRDAQESRIRQVFKHCGKIKRVRFHERDTKRTGGAFVEFEHTGSCDKALALHGKIVDNHPLYVDYQRY